MRKRRIQSLNRELASEYRAIVATIVYSEVLKRASFATIAEELERLAAENFRHAKGIAGQIACLGGIPCVVLEASNASTAAQAMCHETLGEEEATLGDYGYPIHPGRLRSRVTPHSHRGCHRII